MILAFEKHWSVHNPEVATKKTFQTSAVSISTSEFVNQHKREISGVQDTCVYWLELLYKLLHAFMKNV